MKLKTLAIAVAMAAVPFAAQADVTISGDIGVGYMKSQAAGSEGAIVEWGSEVNFDASEKVGGVTYMGHMELDVNGLDGSSLRVDEVRVGAKGGFGEVWVGHADNGCDQLDITADQTWWTGQNGAGCKGTDTGNIVYKRGMGPATVALSHNPGADESAIGVSGNVGKFGVSAGYEDLDGAKNIALGMKAGFGPVTVYADWNELSSDTAGVADVDGYGVNLYYSRNNLNAYVGIGENGTNGYTEAGIGKTVGKTDFILELSESDAGSGTGYLAGMRHRF